MTNDASHNTAPEPPPGYSPQQGGAASSQPATDRREPVQAPSPAGPRDAESARSASQPSSAGTEGLPRVTLGYSPQQAGAASARPPAGVGGVPQSPGPVPSPSFAQQPGPVQDPPPPAPPAAGEGWLKPGHFAKWTVATLATIAGFYGIEIAAVIVVVILALLGAGALNGLSGSGLVSLLTAGSSTMMAFMALVEIVTLCAVVPWWFHVSKRGIGLVRRRGTSGATAHEGPSAEIPRVLALLAVAVGMQLVIEVVLSGVFALFPNVGDSYSALMESRGVGEFTVFTVLAVAIVGPILEETAFRGVAMQFALRAVTPQWSKRLVPWHFGLLRVPPRQFWVANVLQALAFGLAHGNLVQGAYAFASGLVLGWVFWRTGKLRYSMALHVLFNLSSYALILVPDLPGVAGVVLMLALLAVGAIAVAGGLRAFGKATKDEALGADGAPRADGLSTA